MTGTDVFHNVETDIKEKIESLLEEYVSIYNTLYSQDISEKEKEYLQNNYQDILRELFNIIKEM